METRAHTHARRPRRALAALAFLLALMLAGALSAAAAIRPAHAHRGSCSAQHHAKHGSVKHCSKTHGHKPKSSGHKARKPAHKTAPPVPLTPATCEDGSLPARSATGAYSCEDGSEPVCEDGSEPVRPSSASAPMCRPPREEGGECQVGSTGECALELACEDAEEAGDAPQGCEHGSAFEEPEAES
jgi:hypothetical protein